MIIKREKCLIISNGPVALVGAIKSDGGDRDVYEV